VAIEGLRDVPGASVVSVGSDVEVAVEALGLVGLINDRDIVTASVTEGFNQLKDSARTGEAYVQLPRHVVTLGQLITSLDNGNFAKEYPKTYVWDALWTPGKNKDGYKVEELGNLEPGHSETTWQPHARLAVHNPSNPRESLLHFLDMPFDGKYATDGQLTQLDAVVDARQAYEAEHPQFNLRALNAAAVVMLALQRRIKGEPMPITWGFMRDATLTRKTVGGDSCVGRVYSRGAELGLIGSDGGAVPGEGVGLSVGPEALEPQAS